MKTRQRRITGGRVSNAIKAKHKLEGGPWEGHTIWLSSDSDAATGWFQIGSEVGRYVHGLWVPMRAQ